MVRLRPDVPAVRRRYVDVAGGQLHLRSAGPDPTGDDVPLVCLHMSPASGLVYERFAAAMGERRPVLAPDTPGFGASDPTAEPPVIADYAEAVVGLLDALGITGHIDLLGYHTGSLTAVEVAARWPARVRAVVAVSMPLFSDADLERLLRLYDTDPIFDVDGERLLRRWRWFVDFLGADRPGSGNTVADAARVFTARLSGGERHWWGHHAAFAYDLAGRLRDVAAPVVVLNPADDLTEQTRRAAPLLRRGRVVELPHVSHGFLDHATAEAVELVDTALALALATREGETEGTDVP